MSYIAHTPPKEREEGVPHLYEEHIFESLTYGLALFDYLLSFLKKDKDSKELLRKTFTSAIMLHDMGKLDDGNQAVLTGADSGRLPVDHIDAGVAIAASMNNELLGWLIRGHHAPGLPGKKTEKYFSKQLKREMGCCLSATSLRGWRYKRSKETAKYKEDYQKHFDIIQRTDNNLEEYKKRQIESCGNWLECSMELPTNGLTSRLLLSCLVSADHESTSTYCNSTKMPVFSPVKSFWEKRLIALNEYVESLIKTNGNERNLLRQSFYNSCYQDKLQHSKLVMCSAPVGLGKTTSVMAYLLRKSIQDNSSRIIVIAPFSNIIDQTVKTLRKAVVLDGEDPEMIVVAHHHKAEFSDKNMRQYSALWQAPVVVTTAVQFFETLASANPSKLRKLNSIGGAAIFIDESHACLPVEFLRVTWRWLKILSDNWGCNIVFSSGSIVEFWNDEYFVEGETQKLPDIFPKDIGVLTQKSEIHRVLYKRLEKALSLSSIIKFLQDDTIWKNHLNNPKPSCLVILNTVQSCAVIADALSRSFKDLDKPLIKKVVLHLSSALAPKDRSVMLQEIERRQNECEWNNKPWYLIATSCVEAGVDLDFSIGFRERCSVTSFLQVSGRINRHGVRDTGTLYDFTIIAEGGLIHHPGFKGSLAVFNDLWGELNESISSIAELSTKALKKEFSRLSKKREKSNSIFENETKLNFQKVSETYKIIDSNTATVIVDSSLVKKLELGIPVNWQEIQENSVQLWMTKINKLNLTPIKGCLKDDIYSWVSTYEYDGAFLGIMAGLINVDNFFKKEGGVL